MIEIIMLGFKDIARQIQRPHTYRSLQLGRNPHKAASLGQASLLPLLNEDYSDESSKRIARSFERSYGDSTFQVNFENSVIYLS
ncbi:unnamed protein product [Callosobruchus maculatus]|uniref:Uncharacterized protein n=1 Tax=Callosobruchus maculatus TaxID=64391 RepID=A0A653CJH9_CALMS|nr:unnamed protein product [Callosobruchus maculatus]